MSIKSRTIFYLINCIVSTAVAFPYIHFLYFSSVRVISCPFLPLLIVRLCLFIFGINSMPLSRVANDKLLFPVLTEILLCGCQSVALFLSLALSIYPCFIIIDTVNFQFWVYNIGEKNTMNGSGSKLLQEPLEWHIGSTCCIMYYKVHEHNTMKWCNWF